MSHIVDAHVAYCKTISDLSRDKTELLERIKRLEEALDEVYHAGRVGASLRAEKAWHKAKEAKL